MSPITRRHLPLALALTACGPATRAPAPPAPPPDRSAAIETGLLPAVRVAGEDARANLLARMEHFHIHGLSLAVWDHGQIVLAKGYGVADLDTKAPVTADTRFQAGSISKSVNALAVLEAAAAGRLQLDAPIDSQITAWKLPPSDLAKDAPPTIRRLLSHTAGTNVHGFPGYEAGKPVPTLVQVLLGAPPANTPAIAIDGPPGTYRYSGGGVTITQLALVEHGGGHPYPQLLADAVLRPLGMAASTYEQPLPAALVPRAAAGYRADGSAVPGKRNTYPEMAAAGLWTTPSDLARFFLEVERARAGASRTIPQAIAREMTTAVATASPHSQVGLGVFLEQREGAPFFGHDGADEGFQADALASLDGQFGLVIMTNSDNGGRLFPEIVRAVFAAYGWPGLPPPVQRAPADPVELARVAGAYTGPAYDGPVVLEVAGGALAAHFPFTPPEPLIPIGHGVYVAAASGLEYHVDGDAVRIDLPEAGMSRTVTRLPAGAKVPVLEAEAGRFADAVAAFRELIRTQPTSPAASEIYFNQLAYQVMARDPQAALILFRVNAEAHPASANMFDSLGDGYLAVGDKPHALEAYERALALVPADTAMPPQMREAVKRDAAQHIDELRKK